MKQILNINIKILYFQIVYTYDEYTILSKDEILKITNKYNAMFYCKNNMCAYVFSLIDICYKHHNLNRIYHLSR